MKLKSEVLPASNEHLQEMETIKNVQMKRERNFTSHNMEGAGR